MAIEHDTIETTWDHSQPDCDCTDEKMVYLGWAIILAGVFGCILALRVLVGVARRIHLG